MAQSQTEKKKQESLDALKDATEFIVITKKGVNVRCIIHVFEDNQPMMEIGYAINELLRSYFTEESIDETTVGLNNSN
jgi:hypothetical protein